MKKQKTLVVVQIDFAWQYGWTEFVGLERREWDDIESLAAIQVSNRNHSVGLMKVVAGPYQHAKVLLQVPAVVPKPMMVRFPVESRRVSLGSRPASTVAGPEERTVHTPVLQELDWISALHRHCTRM